MTTLHRLLLLLVLAPLSSGCALRYSYAEYDSSWYDGKVRHGGFLPPLELALMTNDLNVGPSAFVFSLEGLSQGLDTSILPPMEDWQSVSVRSLTVGGRFYPFTWGPVLPYGGGGFGRTSLSAKWTEYLGGGFDPLFECVAFCDNTEDESGTILSGYYTYVAAGVEIRTGFMTPSLLLEYRQDFDRGDEFYDLTGRSFSAGFRFRWGG
jgi:hypothetical protein